MSAGKGVNLGSGSGGGGVASVTAGDASITIGGTATNPTVRLPYKVYTVLISQSGTSAPTAIVLQNTLGEVPTYGYSVVGHYTLVSPGGLFAQNKTFIMPNSFTTGSDDDIFAAVWFDNSTIDLFTFRSLATPNDDELNNTSLEIRIYS